MKKKSVTLVQVAASAGVSVMTASRAISGEGYVSEETKARVQAAVAELGYAPHALARVMKGGRTNVIGVVVPDICSPAVTPFISALSREVRQYDMDLFVYDAVGQLDEEKQLRHNRVLHGMWDGLIYILPRFTDEYLRGLEASTRPVVLIGFCRCETSLPVIQGDNVNASRDAVASLIAQGHERIAFIRGSHWTGQSQERERGYRLAMQDAGLAVDERWVEEGMYSEQLAQAAAGRLLTLAPRPTAIFAASDEMAIACMGAAHALGIEVPEELSLIGFDDIPAARIVRPQLTTIRHPAPLMAQAATQELMRRILKQPGKRQRIDFPAEMVMRDSAAPIRREAPKPRGRKR
jgi:LacI family transcriptional regulator